MWVRALNEPELSRTSSEESLSEDGKQQTLGKEALEEQYFDKYKDALLAIKDLRNEDAKETLEDLYYELEDVKNQEETLIHLKYSVLKNLGNLCPNEIDYFIEALEIDSSDISLWIKAGDRGLKLNNLPYARYSYQQALKLNPNNLIAIDRLLELYYILHLPCELYDLCCQALEINKNHKKACILLEESKKIQPTLQFPKKLKRDKNFEKNIANSAEIINRLESIKRKRRESIQNELQRFKRQKASFTLDTSRTQSLSSLGNYIIKIYERFIRLGITKSTSIDILINSSSLSFSQQFSNGAESQTNNQNSSEPQTASSQDVELGIEGDFASVSDSEKYNKNEPSTSNDCNEPKSNNRSKTAANNAKPSAISFAALLFPCDANDKRRSSRNRSATQDDNFNLKTKFNELNDMLPDELRISAIEQILQKKKEDQQISDNEKEKSKEEPVIVETNLMATREDLIIKEVVEAISQKIQFGNSGKNDLRLYDLFFIFLSKLAEKKQNVLPQVFTKIYKIYRNICPFPSGVFIEFGSDGITLEDMWLTLAANEISYKASECSFLLRCLNQLQLYLDEAQHREFLVRLFLILGEQQDPSYLEAVLDNIEEDTKIYATNRKTITRAFVKTLIDRMNEKLQRENEEIENSVDLINKLAPKSENEMSDREVTALCSAIISAGLWQRGLDILNQRTDLSLDVLIDTINECLKNGAKMDAILASKLCKEAITNPRPRVWTCLHRGWKNHLSPEQLGEDDMVETLDKFFKLGHETLGKKFNCTSDNGEFLMENVKHLVVDRDEYEERDVLGAFSCLFGYPSKKPPAVVSHRAKRVPIIWEYASAVYNFFAPDEMPEYMSPLRKLNITTELEQLFKEIVAVVPAQYDPKSKVGLIQDFIDSGKEWSRKREIETNDVTERIYYLLADYYFKNKEFEKAKEFYALDLTVAPDRYDSWAASALIRANEIDVALTKGTVECESFIEGNFFNLKNSALRCFEEAVGYKPREKNATLWIEYGNLLYNLSSLVKRLYSLRKLKSSFNSQHSETIDAERMQQIHADLIQRARRCFSCATTCDSKEAWLHYYMLGKIAEKEDVFEALELYYKADLQLFIEGATYPRKISYHNPPDFAYEAMEVHYRIHSAALKFLLSKDPTEEHLKRLSAFLIKAHRSPFVEFENSGNPAESMKKEDVGQTVSTLLDDLCESIATTGQVNFDELVFMSLNGMKRCLVRCDKNFKALYRLAYYYYKIEDPGMAKSILLSREMSLDRRTQTLLAREPDATRSWRSAPPDLRGIDSLFKDRRIGNLYAHIWRIPVEEVDRPGSFEHWMYKCTHLVICICSKLCDISMLATIAFQLSREPETSKKYLHESARVLLADFAVRSIILVSSQMVEEAQGVSEKHNLFREAAAISERFIKSGLFVQEMQTLNSYLASKQL